MYIPIKNIPNNKYGGIFYQTKLSRAIQYTIRTEDKAINILEAREIIEFVD